MNEATICTCGLIKQSKAGTAVDDDGVTRCNNCGRPTTFSDLAKAGNLTGGSGEGGPGPGDRTPPGRKPIPSLEASGQMVGLLIGGLFALLVGVVGALLSWPRLALDDAGNLVTSGSTAGLAFFGLVCAVGEVLVLIAVIAYGVHLGVRAAGLRDDAARDG